MIFTLDNSNHCYFPEGSSNQEPTVVFFLFLFFFIETKYPDKDNWPFIIIYCNNKKYWQIFQCQLRLLNRKIFAKLLYIGLQFCNHSASLYGVYITWQCTISTNIVLLISPKSYFTTYFLKILHTK